MTDTIQLSLIGAVATLAGVLLHAAIESKKTAAAHQEARKTALEVIEAARKVAETAKAAAEAAAMAAINARLLAEAHLKPR